MHTTKLSPDQASALAIEAYVYAYPIAIMETTRRVATNVTSPGTMRAPVNQFALMRTYPDASFTDVVAPNADTLYEALWGDVSKEPLVISLPALGKRYALFPMLDAWTNVFASPGSRTTGEDALTFAVTGPGWRGTLPVGMKQYRCNTSFFWMIGRIYADGTPADFKAVHQLQDHMSAVPLSAYGKPFAEPIVDIDPSIDMNSPIVQQVNGLNGQQFFTLFAQLFQSNPPPPPDAPMVAKLAQLGIVPERAFDWNALEPALQNALQAAPAAALARIRQAVSEGGTLTNGWSILREGIGTYGTNYGARAMVAIFGLGANIPEDAMYPRYGKPLDGSKHRYVLHFAKGETPPVNAFWSLTLYNKDDYFYGNALDRYNIQEPRDHLVTNPDGSLDIFIQHASPGAEKEANWLPAPAEEFSVILRMYWPKTTVLDGTWTPPAIDELSM